MTLPLPGEIRPGGRRKKTRAWDQEAEAGSELRTQGPSLSPLSEEDHEMPVLKQLGPAQPKKRLERSTLSISAPLGDFRHTLHVGRGGDAFGDTSFLSRHGEGPPPDPRAPPAGAPRPAPPPAPPQPPPPALRTPAPTDPLLSFHLDLGPSMLDAVLGVMDAERPGAAAAKPDIDPSPEVQHPRARCRPNADLELDDVIGL